jgi:hypothetical protein
MDSEAVQARRAADCIVSADRPGLCFIVANSASNGRRQIGGYSRARTRSSVTLC